MSSLEKDLYPIMENWLVKNHQCFKSATNTGLKYSRADVIGIKDIGGDLTGEIETIIIEVKRGTEAFATAAGQAYGYSVYANRVYLADKRDRGFSPEELQIASHLRIGLILIGKGNRISEILSSPYYKPLTKLNASLLERLRLGVCQICNNYVSIGDEKGVYTNLKKGSIKKAFDLERGLIFWNWEVGARKLKSGIRQGIHSTYERRFICKHCVNMLSSING